jgi:hypothetical protein
MDQKILDCLAKNVPKAVPLINSAVVAMGGSGLYQGEGVPGF